jgi:tRNA (guanine37-N1)-methyltransferase
MLDITILTLFPKMFRGPFSESIVKRAQEKKKVRICVVNLRDYTEDPHRRVDDRPFGGGPGMLLSPQPVFSAVDALKKGSKTHVVYLSAQGKPFDRAKAHQLSRKKRLLIVCGHYEGLDERAREHLMDEEISVGNFVTTGGELPAMLIIDATCRLVPGVLGDADSHRHDSFEEGYLEGPQYTRPEVFRNMKVPKVLVSGNHKKIQEWYQKQALIRTRKRRPDLLRGK